MASLDAQGMLVDLRIIQQRSMTIEHGDLDGVHAIVLHQTIRLRASASAVITSARYPVNSDSVGNEMVGRHRDDKTCEAITAS